MLVGRHPANVPEGSPATVMAVDGAPHDQLFPRASVVVHQGGVGTTGQAMRSPAGAGRSFAHAISRNSDSGSKTSASPVSIRGATGPPASLARAAHAAACMSLRAAADAVGQKVRAEGGAVAAAEALLAVLARHSAAPQSGPSLKVLDPLYSSGAEDALATNQTLAGCSASRRMVTGNQ